MTTQDPQRARWRVFIALDGTETARARIMDIQRTLKQSVKEVRWEPPEKLHMTLRFLGETSAAGIPLLSEALHAALSNQPALTLRYATIGAFPSLEHPRVLWIGTHEDSGLRALQESIARECNRLGLGRPEDHPFHPHITLGRMRDPRRADSLTATAKTLTFEPILDRCAGVQIMRSELHPAGSRYAVLDNIPLQS